MASAFGLTVRMPSAYAAATTLCAASRAAGGILDGALRCDQRLLWRKAEPCSSFLATLATGQSRPSWGSGEPGVEPTEGQTSASRMPVIVAARTAPPIRSCGVSCLRSACRAMRRFFSVRNGRGAIEGLNSREDFFQAAPWLNFDGLANAAAMPAAIERERGINGAAARGHGACKTRVAKGALAFLRNGARVRLGRPGVSRWSGSNATSTPGGGHARSSGGYHPSFGRAQRQDRARAPRTTITRRGSRDPDRDAATYTESDHMPDWVGDDAREYWDAADVYERSNGRLYVSADFALPRDLDPDEQVALAHAFAQALTAEERLPYTLAIHAGRDANGQEHNPHAHLMISERQNDGVSRNREQWFRRANNAAPERGGAPKSRTFHRREWMEHARERWADYKRNARAKRLTRTRRSPELRARLDAARPPLRTRCRLWWPVLRPRPPRRGREPRGRREPDMIDREVAKVETVDEVVR